MRGFIERSNQVCPFIVETLCECARGVDCWKFGSPGLFGGFFDDAIKTFWFAETFDLCSFSNEGGERSDSYFSGFLQDEFPTGLVFEGRDKEVDLFLVGYVWFAGFLADGGFPDGSTDDGPFGLVFVFGVITQDDPLSCSHFQHFTQLMAEVFVGTAKGVSIDGVGVDEEAMHGWGR